MSRTAEVPVQERALELEERGGKLGFLSRLLAAPPDSAVLGDAEAAGLIDAGGQTRLEDVQVEYTRLLSCPGPDAVPAHQSVYTDTLQIEPSPPDISGCGMSFPGGAFHGYLGGPSCTEVSRWYSEVGFTPSTDHAHMPDHVAVQLEFVGNLYVAEARALGNRHQEDAAALCKVREGFEQAFLDRWLPRFAERLATNRISELYRRVGQLLLRP